MGKGKPTFSLGRGHRGRWQGPPGDLSSHQWGRLSSGSFRGRPGRWGSVQRPCPESLGSDQPGPTEEVCRVHPRCSQHPLTHPPPVGPQPPPRRPPPLPATAAQAGSPALAHIHLLAVLADLSLLPFVAGGPLKANGGRGVTAHPSSLEQRPAWLPAPVGKLRSGLEGQGWADASFPDCSALKAASPSVTPGSAQPDQGPRLGRMPALLSSWNSQSGLSGTPSPPDSPLRPSCGPWWWAQV